MMKSEQVRFIISLIIAISAIFALQRYLEKEAINQTEIERNTNEYEDNYR